MRRFDTENPQRPALGFDPRPVAPSSLISPPDPVAAPGNGEMAVGWLCVSTFIKVCVTSSWIAVPAGEGVGEEATDRATFHHGRVVRVRGDRALRVRAVRGAHHAEEGMGLALAVDHPRRVEDLVAAVLGVRLREHRELDIGRIAAVAREVLDQVVDLVGRQREAEGGVRILDGPRPRPRTSTSVSGFGEKWWKSSRAASGPASTVSVMRSCSSGRASAMSPSPSRPYSSAALDPLHRVEPALARDVRRLRRPRRDGADARRDEHRPADRIAGGRAVGQQACERLALGRRQVARGLHEMQKPRGRERQALLHQAEAGVDLVEAKRGEDAPAADCQDGHDLSILPRPVRRPAAHLTPSETITCREASRRDHRRRSAAARRRTGRRLERPSSGERARPSIRR